jgi:hypothetical protein
MSIEIPRGHNAVALEVRLYPRSADVLVGILENAALGPVPQYVAIDIGNFLNQLRAHLQRVAIGV